MFVVSPIFKDSGIRPLFGAINVFTFKAEMILRYSDSGYRLSA